MRLFTSILVESVETDYGVAAPNYMALTFMKLGCVLAGFTPKEELE